jgi:uncharacterized YccA/Bax inhibitor family protein
LRTNNPVFPAHFYDDWAYRRDVRTTMTVEGTALKSLVLLAVLMLTAAWSWTQVANQQLAGGLVMGAALGGFVVAIFTTFRPTAAPITAPIYAALQGVFLGAISKIIDMRYHGIASQAVMLTFGVMLLMLFIYATGLIRVTPRLTAAIVAATGALCLVYLAMFLLRIFHVTDFDPFTANPMLGIALSVGIVALAAFNLLLDFEFIQQGSRAGAPKAMEWYGAFGLMVTLVWLYLEIIRLLRLLNDRR